MFMQTQHASQPGTSASALPRVVWIGAGLLSLVAAAMAGALIMRATEHASNPPVVATTLEAPYSAPLAVPARPAAHARKADVSSGSETGRGSAPLNTTPALDCASCGIVESVAAVQQPGQATGLGAVAGGVLGGVVGHQLGGGNGKTAMTVLGAVGGGLAGNEVEKHARSATAFNVRVRMQDGSTRMFQQSQSLAPGTHVLVDGTQLRVANDATDGAPPKTLRTAAPSGART